MDISSFLLMLPGLIIVSPTAEVWTVTSEEMSVLGVLTENFKRNLWFHEWTELENMNK